MDEQTYIVSSFNSYSSNFHKNTYTNTVNPVINVSEQGLNLVSIDQASIVNSMYNVNTYNRLLQIQNGATVYPITLETGNYDTLSLSTEIQSKLNSSIVTSNSVVSFNQLKSVFEIQSDVDITIRNDLMTEEAVDLFGLEQDSQIQSVFDGTKFNVTFTYIPQLIATLINVKFYINDNLFHPIFTASQSYSLSIPVVSDYGFNIFYKPNTPFFIAELSESTIVQSIRVELYDQYDNLLELNGGVSSFNLKFFRSDF